MAGYAARDAIPEEPSLSATAIQSTTAAQRCNDAARAQPPAAGKTGAQQQAQVDGDALQVRVAGRGKRCAAKRCTCSPKRRKCCTTRADGTQQWEATYGLPASRWPSNAATAPAPCPWCWPSACKAARPARYRADLTVQGPWWPWPPDVSSVAHAGSSAQGQCGPGGQRFALRQPSGHPASRSPPHCWAPCWAGSSSTSCPACSRCWPSRWWALPATRKTGAPTASAAWPTPPAWCCRSLRWVRSCWACGLRARPWAGAFSCSRPPWWLRWPGCSPSSG